MPSEVREFERTIRAWFDEICNYHLAKVSNGPTESRNNLIKRIKRISASASATSRTTGSGPAFAGRPNWRVLGSIVVR
jgi:hypothetical protein